MSRKRPLIVTEDKAISLRNKVRRYLVGREQHEEGQFWPLISRVRIYGNFSILSNGVVLVDLPGLNDPNPAREQVTARWMGKPGDKDGVSLFLVVLTGILFPIALFAAKPEHDAKGYYAWLTLLMGGCMGAFLSLDLFLFFAGLLVDSLPEFLPGLGGMVHVEAEAVRGVAMLILPSAAAGARFDEVREGHSHRDVLLS